jgi:hypothetical protein
MPQAVLDLFNRPVEIPNPFHCLSYRGVADAAEENPGGRTSPRTVVGIERLADNHANR